MRKQATRTSTTADHRLARGLRDGVAEERDGSNDGDGIGDTSDTDGEARDDQVGEARAGRLVAEDEGGPATTTRTRARRRPLCTSPRTNEPVCGGQAGAAGEVG